MHLHMLWYLSLTLKLNVDSHTAWKYHPMAQCYQLSSLRYCCAYSIMCSFVILFLWFSFCICHPTVYNHSRLVFFFLDFGFQHFLHNGVPYLSISHNNHGLFHVPSTQRRLLCFDVFIYRLSYSCASIVQKHNFCLSNWTRPPKPFYVPFCTLFYVYRTEII